MTMAGRLGGHSPRASVGAFVGLVTAWDITRELALDTRAWPWNRESRLFSLSGDRVSGMADPGAGA